MKAKIQYMCQECGCHSPFWVGRCPDCGAWNSIVEEMQIPASKDHLHRQFETHAPQAIHEIDSDQEMRLLSNIPEFDRILGGGIVPGSLILIGGDPGIGKSTLLLQISQKISQGKILYISGEESVRQIKMRAERLAAKARNLFVVSETNVDVIGKHLKEFHPTMIVVDSIQVMFKPDIPSAPGSVSQVRECAAFFMYIAKNEGIPIFLVGHVTKDGSIAGPRVLEHMVDTVLYFEGERNYHYRILRAVKNRFGPTNEIGIFDMQEQGLIEVKNPSEIFLEERAADVSGSVVVISMEGTRPILVELQALVSSSGGFGIPRRSSTGIDPNRVSMLIAVLDKRGGVSLHDQDIFVNVAGGIRVTEPSGDLGLIMAIRSSFMDRPIDSHIVFCGEVGLGGEIRGVSQVSSRLKEARRMGFQRAVISANNIKGLESIKGLEILPVKELCEVLEQF